MENERIRIYDIAQELGLSTATVSNVLHGKTKKVSAETVKRVQELVEKSGYIPSMAGILLAQNDSKIIGIVINDHEKYEGRVLEDGFVSSAVNALSRELDEAGYFMMVKTAVRWDEIARFASMWNMEGLVLIGFCEQDYKRLREAIHIPFVVYEGFFKESKGICNVTIDNYDGGCQVGKYLKHMGHKKALCISDSFTCMDMERMDGCADEMGREAVSFMKIPVQKKERLELYRERYVEILEYTAVFAMSDYYAAELICFLAGKGVAVPEDLSVVGFDDSPLCKYCIPPLTTVRQDALLRAKEAVRILRELKNGERCSALKLPVTLIERESVKNVQKISI